MRGRRGDICLCHISHTVHRIWNSLCEEVRQPVFRLVGNHGGRVRPAELGVHIQRKANASAYGVFLTSSIEEFVPISSKTATESGLGLIVNDSIMLLTFEKFLLFLNISLFI